MDILKIKQNGVWTAIPAIIGPRGIGITSITKTGTSGLTDTYTITFSDNTTTTFTLNNGAVPNLTIGTVTEGATAAATITGTAAAPILNLVLPNANVPTRVSELENDSHYAVDANYVHTDNNYTTEEKTKLSGIAAGAEVNVNADWNAVSGDAQILNKPTNVSDFTNDAGYLTEHQDISGKADKTDTILETTLSRGRKAGTTVGTGSFAFGSGVEASGGYASAIGSYTTATGPYSFAQGQFSQAIGLASYAEGGGSAANAATKASGSFSHAEGQNTRAEGTGSHAEGRNVTASGLYSHAENFKNKAIGNYSHAEGYETVATGTATHSSGKYNVQDSYNSWPEWITNTQYAVGDKVKITTTENNSTIITGYICNTANSDVNFTSSHWTQDEYINYVEIIGNGSSSSARSNARALDWSGNEYLKGDLYVHANADSTGGSKVLTAADIAGKQDTLTFDSTPTANSTNPVTSGGVYNAIANVNTMKIHICAQGEYNAETGVPTIQNPDTQTFYLVPGGEGSNLFIEWAYVNSAWERFGSADVEVPVTDVQVNGTSILNTQGVANVQAAAFTDAVLGIGFNTNGKLRILAAGGSLIKAGEHAYSPIVPLHQHASTFYGLAKAAGDSTQSASSNAVGTYTDAAKTAIQTMLDVPAKSDIPTKVSDLTDDSGHYTKPATGIPASDLATGVIPNVPVMDVQVNGTSILSNGVANIPAATTSRLGVVKAMPEYGILPLSTGDLTIAWATAEQIKAGANNYRPITSGFQHVATFYGLAKAAGADMASSSNAVGTYTPAAKAAIQSMLGVSDLIATSEPTLVASKAYAIGDVFTANGKLYKATAAIAANDTIVLQNEGETISGANAVESTIANELDNTWTKNDFKFNSLNGLEINNAGYIVIHGAGSTYIKAGTSYGEPILPTMQHYSTFYGLAKAAGADEKDSTLPVGQYTDTAKTAIRTMLGAVGDVQVNGTSVVTDGVANIPIAGSGTLGLVSNSSQSGILIDSTTGALRIDYAGAYAIKAAASTYNAITPGFQHQSVFYGLARAAGDTTQSSSSNAVGTYTDSAKASIKQMLGIVDGSTGTVDVSGAAPSITAVENTRYVCGEVTSLSFTPAANGICIVRFTSGSTATLLTVPNTVKFPEWFDSTSLETNTIYEICVTDGVYGAVMLWAQ